MTRLANWLFFICSLISYILITAYFILHLYFVAVAFDNWQLQKRNEMNEWIWENCSQRGSMIKFIEGLNWCISGDIVYRWTLLSSCASTTQTRSCSNCSTTQCLSLNKKNTNVKASSGPSSTLVLTFSQLLSLLRRHVAVIIFIHQQIVYQWKGINKIILSYKIKE